MSPPLLEVRGLSKAFPLRGGGLRRRPVTVPAVEDVTLAVAPGETLGIVGESGCGKSTLARMMVRLLDPTSGTVAFEGRDVTWARGPELRALRREVQMVFQDPYASLNPRRSVGAAIADPLEIHGLHPELADRRRAVAELLERVGLAAGDAGRYPHELSGGQRQRVGIARALALRPKLLVADEAVSALDASVQAQVLELLRDLRDALGLTLVLIAHDLSVVREMSDRVAVMYLGRVVELAPAGPFFAGPRMPYGEALLAAAPVPDPEGREARRAARPPVLGEVPSRIAPPSGCAFHPRCPYADARCTQERPQLEDSGGDRWVACHHPR